MQAIALKDLAGDQEMGDALCKALAKLPKLEIVVIHNDPFIVGDILTSMAPVLPLLTQIRYILHRPADNLPCLYAQLNEHAT